MVNGNSATRSTLRNLEEKTSYTITVQAIVNNETSVDSTAVLVTTYADGK